MIGNTFREGILKYLTGVAAAPSLPASLSLYPLMNNTYTQGDVIMNPAYKGDTGFSALVVDNDATTWQYESAGYMSNVFSFVFDAATVDWGTVRYVMAKDTSNEVYIVGSLLSPELILAGQTLRIPTGSCKIKIPNVG